MEITCDQGSEFISHDFRKYLIEKYFRLTNKPSTSGNPTSNAILEHINQVMENLVQTCNIKITYIDKNDPWSGILSAAAFAIR